MPSTAASLNTWFAGILAAVNRGAAITMDMHHCGRGKQDWRISIEDNTMMNDHITQHLIDAGVDSDHIWYSDSEWRLIDGEQHLYCYVFQHANDPLTWVAVRLIGGVVQPATRGTCEDIIRSVAGWSREQENLPAELAELWPN
jgi:hypothetical protein